MADTIHQLEKELKDLREGNKALINECDRLIKEKGELLIKVSGGDVLRICQLEEKLEKAKAMLLDSFYTVEVMCNKISDTIGCEKCTYYNPDTHYCEVRTYLSRTRAFVKGGENDA
jgi:predicted nuclease with TOPRIM domain